MDNPQTDHDAQVVALLTQVQLPLVLYVRSLMPGSAMAKDVAQQANVKIWEKRDEFQLGTNFKAWAFSIARYEVLSHRKRSHRDAKLTFSPDLQEAITDDLVHSEEDFEPMHEALRNCLSLLKPQDRQLLLHRYSKSAPLSAYASEVGRTVGGLKVTLHRLRNRLMECIGRQLSSAEGTP